MKLGPEQLNSEQWARAFVEQVIPDRELRLVSLRVFVESISEAARLNPSCWVVQAKPGRHPWAYLHVGHHIIACLVRMGLWLALDGDMAEERGVNLGPSGNLPYWRLTSEGLYAEYPKYKPIGSINGYYVPGSEHERVWPSIRALHLASVRKAADYRPLTVGSLQLHSAGMLKYIQNELHAHVPEPGRR